MPTTYTLYDVYWEETITVEGEDLEDALIEAASLQLRHNPYTEDGTDFWEFRTEDGEIHSVVYDYDDEGWYVDK